ncbi:hypothetical protein ASD50_17140 [Mesorhizobium sp. Root552]|uniref:hypothetical protein n=1 Tax=Mesorhizobium sp. Root552 TaxID=1736555 RepID=UPI0006F7FFA3|nr:hypothetical protein [Mesorhizobium sp. Root552]KQZ30742.1 hypothetical protein ASD50_17140 [Mesorhizobium sp. Root552]
MDIFIDGAKRAELQHEVEKLISKAMTSHRIVNVPVIAEQVWQRCPGLNVALEDIEAMVLTIAERHIFPMEFDGRTI